MSESRVCDIEDHELMVVIIDKNMGIKLNNNFNSTDSAIEAMNLVALTLLESAEELKKQTTRGKE